jgi:hypothetical protein
LGNLPLARVRRTKRFARRNFGGVFASRKQNLASTVPTARACPLAERLNML